MIIIGGGVVLSKNSFLNTDFASGIYGLVFMVFVVFFIRFEWKHLDLTKTKIFFVQPTCGTILPNESQVFFHNYCRVCFSN